MKKIGLIGGITPESTILYYRILNDLASKYVGNSHSAKVIMHSFDFGEIATLQKNGDWDSLNHLMAQASVNLEKAGAACILICANTMHLCIDATRKAVSIPVLHIADETSKEIVNKKIKKVGLLGTKYTMEMAFFKEILVSNNVQSIVPSTEDRNEIHRIIYDELSKGECTLSSKEFYLKTIQNLIDNGAEGIVLGCTEIPLLIHQDDVSVPVFDTTTIHATAAFNFAVLK